MQPFFLLAGLVLGVVFSAPLLAGVTWCIQITLREGWRAGSAAGVGLALAQGFWGGLAAVLIFTLARWVEYLDATLRLMSAAILIAMGLAVQGAGKVTSLRYEGPVRGVLGTFKHTAMHALFMPRRFAGYCALLVAVSLHLRPHGYGNAVLLAIGVAVGSLGWWWHFVLLSRLFGKQVPEEISLKSLNKLRVLGVAVFGGLCLIGLAPLIPGF